MTKLHSQLAIFGAIDQEVTNAKIALKDGATGDDAQTALNVIQVAETFLPGTARFGQNRWYEELTTFLSKPELRAETATSEGVVFPSLESAVGELTRIENEPGDRDPVLARATFGAVILAKIYALTREDRAEYNFVLSILDNTLQSWPKNGVTIPGQALVNEIDKITDRASWAFQAAQVISQEFADAALPCFGGLKKTDGRYCAYITTSHPSKDLSVSDIAKIIEPVNWDDLCTFFCETVSQAGPFSGAGASRMLERISGECDEYSVATALTFWKTKDSNDCIYLNYDIDTRRDQDNLIVAVDSGYILVTAEPPADGMQTPGVRISTSKLERVSGLSPTATAALACLMGWGTFANEMFAGKARKYVGVPVPPPPIQPFRRSPNDLKTYADPA